MVDLRDDGNWHVDVSLISTCENASHIVGVRFIAGVQQGCCLRLEETFCLG